MCPEPINLNDRGQDESMNCLTLLYFMNLLLLSGVFCLIVSNKKNAVYKK